MKGLFITLEVSAISLILSFIFGLFSALFSISNSFMLKFLSTFYVETIRNTPLLIQIFFNYFVISPIFDISPFVTAILTLSLFEGAYASEIIRGGINSIPLGQYEAARSLGLTEYQMYRFIVLPQALKNVAPPLASQGISLIKDSSLISTISVYELTLYGQAIVSETFLSFEVWFTIALIYLIINVILSAGIKIFSKKVARSAI
ncbi:amino acid ABC transporter permease [Deferribacterales bacterium Es71-Z0220]|uniref:amino acid ABC transporter permease n=1 Tax=Deferrivibrio essentukiensis TaxID=2880922 RepID=UPI003100B9BA|nr:amino acid ABC transporter permease [Deferrivibrio essentukiensis]